MTYDSHSARLRPGLALRERSNYIVINFHDLEVVEVMYMYSSYLNIDTLFKGSVLIELEQDTAPSQDVSERSDGAPPTTDVDETVVLQVTENGRTTLQWSSMLRKKHTPCVNTRETNY